MGGNLSRPYGGEGETPYPGLADIPESCVARIFEHLGPIDICKLAGLNWAFKGASSCDYVWEQKLPICYQEMLSKLFISEHHFLSKKQIYALLCHPISFDDATKEVWLDRATGGVCLSISARAMAITGIDDHRYWRWIPYDESRFCYQKKIKRGLLLFKLSPRSKSHNLKWESLEATLRRTTHCPVGGLVPLFRLRTWVILVLWGILIIKQVKFIAKVGVA